MGQNLVAIRSFIMDGLNLLSALEFQGRETQMHSMLTLILSGVTEYGNLFPSFTLL